MARDCSLFINNESLEHGLGNVVALGVNHCEDLVGIEHLLHLEVVNLLLLLVPVPFVDLAGLQSGGLSKLLHEGSSPALVLGVFILEDLDLLLVLPPPLLFVRESSQ
jgi:hypothetical protein